MLHVSIRSLQRSITFQVIESQPSVENIINGHSSSTHSI